MFSVGVTYIVQKSIYQKDFLRGKSNLPSDGFYKGTPLVLGIKKSNWQGKAFANHISGFNIFHEKGIQILSIITPFYSKFSKNEDGTYSAYNFKTYIAKGIREEDKDVIKLDYNLKENPFFIRVIMDEIVEVAKNEYMGKIHLRVFPGFYITLGYFRLRK